MSRSVIFFLALALVCGISQAGIRDWLDRADDLARGLESIALFPSRIIYSILGTRRRIDGPLKRVTAESSDRSDLITIIRSPHSPLEMSNLRYLDEPGDVNGVHISPNGLIGKITNRLSNRLDKVQTGITNRLGNVADKLASKAVDRLDKVSDRVTDKLSQGLTNGIDGISDRLINGVGGGMTNQLADRFGGLFSGGKKKDEGDEATQDPWGDIPTTKATQRPRNTRAPTTEPQTDNSLVDNVASVGKGLANAMGSLLG